MNELLYSNAKTGYGTYIDKNWNDTKLSYRKHRKQDKDIPCIADIPLYPTMDTAGIRRKT